MLLKIALFLFFLTSSCLSQSVFENADAINNYVRKLYRINPDGSYRLFLEMQIEIKTYKGKKEWADFKYPYNSQYQEVFIRKARTILPSGRVKEVTEKEIHDILDPSTSESSLYSKARLKVINFPSVEIGSKLEIRIELLSKIGFWAKENFRLLNPTREKKVILDVPSHMKLTVSIKDPKVKFEKKKKGERVIYIWEGRDLPKLYDEPNSPEIENQPFCLLVSSFGSWKDVANFFKNFFKLQRKIRPPSWAKKDPDLCYMLLLKHINLYPLDLFKSSLIPQDPYLTLKKGYGSSIDLAFLFYSILKSQGKDVDLFLANKRGLFILKESYFPELFDQILVYTDGKFYSFSERYLSPGFTGSEGTLGLSIKEGRLIKIPEGENKKRREISMSISSEGAYGKVKDEFWGIYASQIRRSFRYLKGEELKIRISKYIHSMDPLAKVKDFKIEDLKKKVEISFSFLTSNPFMRSEDLLLFPIPEPDIISHLSRLLTKRRYPLFIPRTKTEIFKLKLILPEGIKPVFIPSSFGKEGPLCWDIRYRLRKNCLVFLRRLTLKRSMIPVEDVKEVLEKTEMLCSIKNRVLIFEYETGSSNKGKR